MIYVTGDKHIPHDLPPLIKYLDNNELTIDDYLIICGDVGFLWNLSEEYNYWLDWFNQQKFTTLYVDGNHENFDLLESLPVEIWNGGKVHKLKDNVIHLMRGEIFTIEDKKFFAFGGGDSVDKQYRTENISWWAREMPSNEEYENGLNNLALHDNKVDYIITHSCSSKTFHKISQKYYMLPIHSSINQYFDIIEEKVKFKKWILGHCHLDEKIDKKHIVLYDDIIKI
jgi:DNA repair exonuclease SbcCD nuclease subunit